MFMVLSLRKFHLSKNGLLLVLLSCFILIGFKPLVTEGVLQKKESAKLSQTAAPLLLNNEMVKAQEAEISIILWIEDGIIPHEIWTQLPMSGWVWSQKDQQTERGNVASTLTGHQVIDKNQERMIYTWYTTIAPVLAKDGVKTYLDERVPEAIDISAYLSRSNTLPAQWFLLNNEISIAGYQGNLGAGVMAGHDRVNIQLLSRGRNTNGHTVLALPTLLKEF